MAAKFKGRAKNYDEFRIMIMFNDKVGHITELFGLISI